MFLDKQTLRSSSSSLLEARIKAIVSVSDAPLLVEGACLSVLFRLRNGSFSLGLSLLMCSSQSLATDNLIWSVICVEGKNFPLYLGSRYVAILYLLSLSSSINLLSISASIV